MNETIDKRRDPIAAEGCDLREVLVAPSELDVDEAGHRHVGRRRDGVGVGVGVGSVCSCSCGCFWTAAGAGAGSSGEAARERNDDRRQARRSEDARRRDLME